MWSAFLPALMSMFGGAGAAGAAGAGAAGAAGAGGLGSLFAPGMMAAPMGMPAGATAVQGLPWLPGGAGAAGGFAPMSAAGGYLAELPGPGIQQGWNAGAIPGGAVPWANPDIGRMSLPGGGMSPPQGGIVGPTYTPQDFGIPRYGGAPGAPSGAGPVADWISNNRHGLMGFGQAMSEAGREKVGPPMSLGDAFTAGTKGWSAGKRLGLQDEKLENEAEVGRLDRRAQEEATAQTNAGARLPSGISHGGFGELARRRPFPEAQPDSNAAADATVPTGPAPQGPTPNRQAYAEMLDEMGDLADGQKAELLAQFDRKYFPLSPTVEVPENVATPAITERLLDRVKQVESGGDPNAVSPKGAKGAYQLMDPTAREMGVKDPFNEAESREGARKYLEQNLKKYGSVHDALIAYNYGPGNTDKWIAAGRDPSQLPAETRNYLIKMGVTEDPAAPPAQELVEKTFPMPSLAGKAGDRVVTMAGQPRTTRWVAALMNNPNFIRARFLQDPKAAIEMFKPAPYEKDSVASAIYDYNRMMAESGMDPEHPFAQALRQEIFNRGKTKDKFEKPIGLWDNELQAPHYVDANNGAWGRHLLQMKDRNGNQRFGLLDDRKAATVVDMLNPKTGDVRSFNMANQNEFERAQREGFTQKAPTRRIEGTPEQFGLETKGNRDSARFNQESAQRGLSAVQQLVARTVTHPQDFGVAGSIRRTLQSGTQMGKELWAETQNFISSSSADPKVAAAITADFDKAPTVVAFQEKLLAFHMARLLNPEGRVTNQNYEEAQKLVNLQGITSAADAQARLIQIQRMFEAQIAANERMLGRSGGGGAAAPAGPGAPQVGDVVDGYRFNGGDPADRSNWEEAE